MSYACSFCFAWRPWVPFITTIFLFIFVSNWSGALIPWKLFEIPAAFVVRCRPLPLSLKGFADSIVWIGVHRRFTHVSGHSHAVII